MGSLERHRNKLSVMVWKELFVPIHFQWLKLLLHIFSASPFVVLSHRGGGHTNHLLFQANPRTCVSLLLSLCKGFDYGGSSPCCVTGGTSREVELCSGGFFSLSQYCSDGISGMGCGRSPQHVLQLATPGGVLGVFPLCWEPVWVTHMHGRRCRCCSSSSWGLWGVWRSWPVRSCWGLWLLQCPTSRGWQECEAGKSCGFWVGFVLCPSPQMPPELCLAHPGIPCFYVVKYLILSRSQCQNGWEQ